MYACLSFVNMKVSQPVQDAVVKLIRRAAEIEKLRSEDSRVSNKEKITHFIPLADICF